MASAWPVHTRPSIAQPRPDAGLNILMRNGPSGGELFFAGAKRSSQCELVEATLTLWRRPHP